VLNLVWDLDRGQAWSPHSTTGGTGSKQIERRTEGTCGGKTQFALDRGKLPNGTVIRGGKCRNIVKVKISSEGGNEWREGGGEVKDVRKKLRGGSAPASAKVGGRLSRKEGG